MLLPGMRVGLYGGTFDPAHAGHAHVAETARRRLGLDRVIWLVAPQNPVKAWAASTPLPERMESARRQARGPGMIISDIEARLGGAGARYTIDTLRAFKARYPGVRFVWIMGADNLASFHHWRGWTALMREVPIAVVSRPHIALRSRFAAAARRFAFARRPASAARTLPFATPPAWTYLPAPFHAVSSTALRG